MWSSPQIQDHPGWPEEVRFGTDLAVFDRRKRIVVTSDISSGKGGVLGADVGHFEVADFGSSQARSGGIEAELNAARGSQLQLKVHRLAA